MRTYNKASTFSKKHPTQLVEFRDLYYNKTTCRTGFLLNGVFEGKIVYYQNGNKTAEYIDICNSKTSHVEHTCFWKDGSIERHYFTIKDIMHGEYIRISDTGSVSDNYFVVNNQHVKELDYMINEPRDEAFYVTLALYGIDKEYTIG